SVLRSCCLQSSPTRRSSDLLLIAAFVLGVMLSLFAVRYGPKRFHPPAEALLSQQVAPHGSAVWMSYALLVIGAVSTLIPPIEPRSEEHTSELQSRFALVCRL